MDVPPGRRMRLLAPAALIAFTLLLLVVLASSVLGGTDSEKGAQEPAPAASGQREGAARPDAERPRGPATYRVQPGDTLGSISEQTGRSAEQLEDLNPGLDAQALQPGQRLKLRE